MDGKLGRNKQNTFEDASYSLIQKKGMERVVETEERVQKGRGRGFKRENIQRTMLYKRVPLNTVWNSLTEIDRLERNENLNLREERLCLEEAFGFGCLSGRLGLQKIG